MKETKYHQIPLELEMSDSELPVNSNSQNHTQLQIANPDSNPSRTSSQASSKYKYQVEPANSIYSRDSSKSYRISAASNPPPPLPPKSTASSSPTPIDAINRLEVESTSTTSIPISIPYYYIANQSTSLDTVNLLGNNNGNSTPQYSNTSHIASPVKPSFGKINSASPNRNGTNEISPTNPKQSVNKYDDDLKEDAYFNQLPKRFSQFIIDQKNPFMAQKLDNLSLSSINSKDLARHNQVGYRKASNGTKNKQDSRSYSTHSSSQAASRSRKSNYTHRKSGTNSTAYSQTDAHNTYSHTRSISGDISNSMGSQATIFSTRPDLQHNTTSSNLDQSINNNQNNRNNMNYSRSRLRRSKTRARMYTTDSDSTLSRSKAIKFKDGSWIYRLKLRINKCINKLKHLKFRNFTASNKRTGSITRKSRKSKKLARAKSTLSKKYNNIFHSGPVPSNSIRNKISAPTNNPNLGFRKVETVDEVDDELKYLAGAPEDSLNITENFKDLHRSGLSKDQSTNSPGRYHHLSTYIDQQQNNYSQTKEHRFSTRSNITNSSYFRDEGNMSPGERQRRDDERDDGRSLDPARQLSLKAGSVTAQTEATNSTVPPLPPPHLDEYTLESFMINQEQQKEVNDLWKSYLKHVLSKRIQLRQEINLFRTFVADSYVPPNQNGFDIYEDAGNIYKGQTSTESQRPVGESVNDLVNTQSIERPDPNANNRSAVKAQTSPFPQQGESQSGTSAATTSNSEYESFADTVSESASELNDVDSTTAKFQSAYLNRRSMLGDMLDYESSDADSMVSFAPSVTSSKEEENEVASLLSSTRSRVLSNSNSYDPSFNGSDIAINKRYGTISRRSSTLKSNRQAKPATTPVVATAPSAAMRRSQGIQVGLNSLNEVKGV